MLLTAVVARTDCTSMPCVGAVVDMQWRGKTYKAEILRILHKTPYVASWLDVCKPIAISYMYRLYKVSSVSGYHGNTL